MHGGEDQIDHRVNESLGILFGQIFLVDHIEQRQDGLLICVLDGWLVRQVHGCSSLIDNVLWRTEYGSFAGINRSAAAL